jgi:DNA-directed RNA polymerase subunit RPC12/RpoP
MPRFCLDCTYCGSRFERYLYDRTDEAATLKCPTCGAGHKELKYTPVDESSKDVFGYLYEPGDKRRI